MVRCVELLSVENLNVHFPVGHSFFRRGTRSICAIENVSFAIEAGETVGLVGESGCGKTTLGRAMLKLVEPTGGRIIFEGEDLSKLTRKEMRSRRGRLQMIFQDPYSSLNPRMTVMEIIGEALDIHRIVPNRTARRERIAALLRDVGLDPLHAQSYPHEFSGGQRQRIGIARALAVDPKLIVCDEPVSALDLSVQAQIINLLRDLQRARGMAYLFIAHDLAVVEHISHRILVMYLGRIVESGPAREVCRTPMHPYTQALISAIPVIDRISRRKRIVLSGDVPSPVEPPSGCAFHTRCPRAEARCSTESPTLRPIQGDRQVACHFA
jgi:oligopeptide transport system ATP-binding protein